jgi:hypothetical protein
MRQQLLCPKERRGEEMRGELRQPSANRELTGWSHPTLARIYLSYTSLALDTFFSTRII